MVGFFMVFFFLLYFYCLQLQMSPSSPSPQLWILNANSEWFQLTIVRKTQACGNAWSINNVCCGTGWGMAAHLPHTRPPESLLRWTSANHSLHHGENALPSAPHVIHSKILHFLLTLKQRYTYKSALSPTNLITVKQSTKPKSHSHHIYCPLYFRVLDNPQLVLFH